MRVINTKPVRDWRKRIIGHLEYYDNGDIKVTDFYHRILGRYIKSKDRTVDFYGRDVGKGDLTGYLIGVNQSQNT